MNEKTIINQLECLCDSWFNIYLIQPETAYDRYAVAASESQVQVG